MVDKFLQDIGRISNPDDFSEAEAIHPSRRGKKIIFYHASTSPIAPHLKVHPIVQDTIDALHSVGIIKPEELEAARSPETLLQIIGRIEDGPFKRDNADNLRNTANFLSGEFDQDSASVFHAGTLSAARERMNMSAQHKEPIYLHSYETDTSMMEPVIYDDEMIVRATDVDQLRERKIISLQAGDAQKNTSLFTSSERTPEITKIKPFHLTTGGEVFEFSSSLGDGTADTVATGQTVALSGRVHPYRNHWEDVGNISVSIPKALIDTPGVKYLGGLDMSPVMNEEHFDEVVRQPIVAARRALSTLDARVSSATDDIAESAGIVQKAAKKIGVMSRGTLAKVIQAGETAARVMR